MAANRERPRRGEVHRAKKTDMELHLETRRAEMYAAEGHAGSIPRGNQEAEQEPLGQRRHEWERVLGH
ncbi:MAG TPA: hypothetical protein VI028_03290 [Solirubrobacterales bacterium]